MTSLSRLHKLHSSQAPSRTWWYSKVIHQFTQPFSLGCQFGVKIRKPWQIRTSTNSGEFVSVDQRQSAQDAFIAQLKGCLTWQQYKASTIFGDHFSNLQPLLCTFPPNSYFYWFHWSQESIWKFYSKTLCPHTTIPLWQWLFCWQCFHLPL